MTLFFMLNPKNYADPTWKLVAAQRLADPHKKREEHAEALIVQQPQFRTEELNNKLLQYQELRRKEDSIKEFEKIESVAKELERIAMIKYALAVHILRMEEEEGALLLLLLD